MYCQQLPTKTPLCLIPWPINVQWKLPNFTKKEYQRQDFWIDYEATLHFKHEYLRSRAYICLLLSSPFPSSSCDISSILYIIEILVLLSWIPASKEFCYRLIYFSYVEIFTHLNALFLVSMFHSCIFSNINGNENMDPETKA